MASCAPDDIVPATVNKVFYHQEFDTKMFNYTPPKPSVYVRSFVNVLSGTEIFKEDWELFLALERLIPEFKFESYGASCREGIVAGHNLIAEKMQTSLFGFHLKGGGDGFGHIIHNWFAMGRPPIVKMDQYQNQLAGDLMEDGVTCVNIDGLDVSQAANKIKHYASVDMYPKLAEGAYNRFKKIVNYDLEFDTITDFLDNLI